MSKVTNDVDNKASYNDFKKAMEALNRTMTKNSKGEVAIAPLGEMGSVEVETISSGSLVLDSLAGGGFPRGRLVEIYGPEASGKTSIALNAIADVQRKGGNALFIDAEQALDPNYARILGVDTDKLGITQLSIAEQILYTARTLAESGTVDLIVIDSVASMIPQEEFDNPDKVQVALLARVLSKHLRMLATVANQNNCTIILLNQIREKVGVMFGNPETTPGGRALKFFASQRIHVSRVGQYKEGNEILGTEVRFRIVKNKIAPPFAVGTTILTFAQGINRPAELIEVGPEYGSLNVRGRTYSFASENPEKFEDRFEFTDEGEVKLGTSKKAAMEALEQDKELFEEVAERTRHILEFKREGRSMEDALKALQADAPEELKGEEEVF